MKNYFYLSKFIVTFIPAAVILKNSAFCPTQQWDKLLYEYFGFSLSGSFHQRSIALNGILAIQTLR